MDFFYFRRQCALLLAGCREALRSICVCLLSALFTRGPPFAAVLNCVVCLLDVDGCGPKSLVPVGGTLSELLECVQVVICGVAWSEACLVVKLVGVLCGLQTSEEELMAMTVPPTLFVFCSSSLAFSVAIPHLV